MRVIESEIASAYQVVTHPVGPETFGPNRVSLVCSAGKGGHGGPMLILISRYLSETPRRRA